jgi:hypothetical protein
MSLASDLRALRDGLRVRIADLTYRLRRTAPGPALVRLIAAGAALAGFVAAVPGPMARSAALVPLAVVAAGVGLFPRTRWVSLTMLATVGAWVVNSIENEVSWFAVRAVAIMVALYVTHSAAALAAVLPYDAVMTAGMVTRWALRVGAIVSVSLVLAVSAVLLLAVVPVESSVVGPIAGAVTAAALAGLLVWSLRRRT